VGNQKGEPCLWSAEAKPLAEALKITKMIQWIIF